jgi:biopolymer transport protein ExbB
MVQWLEYGGVMLIPIALASLLGVTLFVARLRAHQPHRVLPPLIRLPVLQAIREEDWELAQRLTRNDPSALARVYHEALRFRGSSRAVLRDAMQEVGRREMTRLERFVGGVGAMASVTPLMGLLGTVLGMIRVFRDVVDEAGTAGFVDPTALAGGIWEALVTTAAGLAVAIPLYLGYRYLLGRLDALAVDLEEAAASLLDELAPPPNPSCPAVTEKTPPLHHADASQAHLAAEGA